MALELVKIQGDVVIPGSAQGAVVYTNEPLSFWGGYSAREGRIIDTHHELYGTNVVGKVLVLPGARGSSTGSGILLEAIRLGTAPAAMILKRRDAILALGAIVGRELYNTSLPIVIVSEEDFPKLQEAQELSLSETGFIEFEE